MRAKLPDERLVNRLDELIEQLSDQPEASIPQACGSAGSKAAYRFLG